MAAAVVQNQIGKAEEYLHLLRSLASEIERAMDSISRNALGDLEESIASQQVSSARLVVLAEELSVPLKADPAASPNHIDADLMSQVRVAADELRTQNRRYAALLQYSSRSTALMASLFASSKGQFQEASGPRLKYQTWSCQV